MFYACFRCGFLPKCEFWANSSDNWRRRWSNITERQDERSSNLLLRLFWKFLCILEASCLHLSCSSWWVFLQISATRWSSTNEPVETKTFDPQDALSDHPCALLDCDTERACNFLCVRRSNGFESMWAIPEEACLWAVAFSWLTIFCCSLTTGTLRGLTICCWVVSALGSRRCRDLHLTMVARDR